MFSALRQAAWMAHSCLLWGQGCLTESFLWQIESPNSALLSLRRLISLHRIGAQEPSKVLSWLKLYAKAVTKAPRWCQEKHRGYQVSTPFSSPITFPSDDPSSSGRSVPGLPTRSWFKYSLRNGCGPQFKCQVYHFLILWLRVSYLASRGLNFLICKSINNHTCLIELLWGLKWGEQCES